ncbi:MAG: hypothetical protein SVS15_01170 [Thermodesulfobacteriota bacterium]|nr:hypothetical protein [Thermodesulfobacteriota bacterium]
MSCKFLLKILSLIALCLISSHVWAYMIAMDTEKLAKLSDLIVIGEVDNVECYWSEDKSVIITKGNVAIKEIIEGISFHKNITVEYIGGEIDGVGLGVSDMPSLKKGEKVMLFLKSGASKINSAEQTYHIVGSSQGKYTINEHDMAKKEGFVVPPDELSKIDNNIPVEELINKIKQKEQ